MARKTHSLFDRTIVGPALWGAFRKLDPRVAVRNPVMFVVLVGAVVTTIESIAAPWRGQPLGFGRAPRQGRGGGLGLGEERRTKRT